MSGLSAALAPVNASPRRLWLGYGSAALAAGAVGLALTLASDHEEQPLLAIGFGLVAGWSFVVAGLIAWTRRRWNRTGALMVAVGFGVFLGALAESNESVPFTIGAAFGGVFVAVFLHLLLAFPSGRLRSRLERVVVGAGYVLMAGAFLPYLFDRRPDGPCRRCPANAFLIAENHAAFTAVSAVGVVLGAVAVVGAVYVLVRRYRAATEHQRRLLAPVLLAGGATVLLLAIGVSLHPVSHGVGIAFSIAATLTFVAVPFVFLGGLLRTSIARGSTIGQLFLEIPDEPSPEQAQAGLRRALADPTLELAYWDADRDGYVDAAGRPFTLPEDTDARVVTRIDYGDRPVAALVHDRSLRDEPELLNTVVGAARVAIDRDRLEAELRSRVGRYSALLAAIPDLMFRISRDGRYLDYQAPDPENLLTPDVIGRTVYDRLPRELADKIMRAGEVVLALWTPQSFEYELDLHGEHRYYEGRVAASGSDEFLLIVREITERKRQEEELQNSRARIVEAGDAERRRLERNLHDGAQQRLVSLSLALRLAQDRLHRDPDGAERLLEGAREELAQALDELRELARGIHPAILTDRGLEPALEALAARSSLAVDLEATSERLPPAVEAAAYYVVSEALANVVKYARASSVRVTVGRENGQALVEVADDGVGGADPTHGSGLRGLADRVAALRGHLDIDSPPGAGTRVRARIPLQ